MPESRIDDLNPEQLRAATAGEGPVLTIAGAGTGKTKTLAARMAWLVSQGIDPGRIMLLTFTRRASVEMLRRARRALGETGSCTLGTVWGGTFHSVANRLLRTYGEAIGLDPDFTVIDQSDAEDLMDASRHDNALGSKENGSPANRRVSRSTPVASTVPIPSTIPWRRSSMVHRVGAGTAATFQIVYRSKAGAACARLRRSPPLLVSSAWRRDTRHSLERTVRSRLPDPTIDIK